MSAPTNDTISLSEAEAPRRAMGEANDRAEDEANAESIRAMMRAEREAQENAEAVRAESRITERTTEARDTEAYAREAEKHGRRYGHGARKIFREALGNATASRALAEATEAGYYHDKARERDIDSEETQYAAGRESEALSEWLKQDPKAIRWAVENRSNDEKRWLDKTSDWAGDILNDSRATHQAEADAERDRAKALGISI